MADLDPYQEHLGAIHDDSWARHAACVGLDKLQILEGDDEKAAKALCAGCPVIQQCGENTFRLDRHADPEMVIAGLTKKERDSIRRQIKARRQKNKPTLPRMLITKKQCRLCEQTLPRNAFYREPRRADGLSNACMPCKRTANAAAARRRREIEKAAAA